MKRTPLPPPTEPTDEDLLDQLAELLLEDLRQRRAEEEAA